MTTLYPYQQRVKELIQSGHSVILQAPTGAGKTRAALAPFIEAFFEFPASRFPKQCIYSVPMRALATQFEAEYKKLAQKHSRLYWEENLNVTIQTGARPEDHTFLGDLIFATIDQSLSSALAVPYSLSGGRSNLNAGAFYASYLIFDEFHLFPVDEKNGGGALTTTVQLLSRLKGLVPFILMTATFSSGMLEELAQRLEAVVVIPDQQEYEMIAGLGGKPPRQREYHVHDAPISAKMVFTTHHARSLAICNQVARAQALYEDLRALTQGADTEVLLLHSRFTQQDRRAKEERIRREFGKKLEERRSPSLILVATQVVEVGLDITCEHLHTEIAPANAVLQRAGRCARYPGEQGHVHIYPVPEKKGRNGTLRPVYLPYPRDLSEKAWVSFSVRDGMIIDFAEEQRIIDEVHLENDRRLLEAMDRQTGLLWDSIYEAMAGDRGQRRTLIRKIDNITVLAARQPDDLGNPFLAQGFGLWRGTVRGLHRRLQELEAEEVDPLMDVAETWRMKALTAVERNPDDPTRPIEMLWQEVTDADMLDEASIVVINSRFCAYDDQVGFCIVPSAGGWASPPGPFKPTNSQGGFSYKLESYQEHIGNMLRLYRQRFQDRLAYVDSRLPQLGELPAGDLDRAIRTAIALHDVAKMDKRWQQWVRIYQDSIGEAIVDQGFMAVHTHWRPDLPTHRAARDRADRSSKRPPHAGESAVASARIIGDILAGNEVLVRAVITAIARHHSASAHSYGEYALHPGARKAVSQALALAAFPDRPVPLLMTPPDIDLEAYFSERRFIQQVLYLLTVRYLRLTDGLSQEEK